MSLVIWVNRVRRLRIRCLSGRLRIEEMEYATSKEGPVQRSRALETERSKEALCALTRGIED